MKHLILTFFLIFFSQNIKAQETNFNPYNEVLKEYLISLLDNGQNENIASFEILENDITSDLIKNINYKNRIIDIKVINKKELLGGKYDAVIQVFPIRVLDNKLSISIIHFGIEIIKRKKINFINSGIGMRYDLKYNCNTNGFYIKKNED